MKKFLGAILAATVILIGCAGMVSTENNLIAQYYNTDIQGETHRIFPETDWPIIKAHATDDDGIVLNLIWRDELNTAVGLRYAAEETNESVCAVALFDDILPLDTANWGDMNPIRFAVVDCELLQLELERQLGRE